MYKVTHHQSFLSIYGTKPYGKFRIFIEGYEEAYDTPPLSLTKFTAMSLMLKSDEVYYDPEYGTLQSTSFS